LSRILDPTGGSENERGWYALGAELGVLQEELEKLPKRSMGQGYTKFILREFNDRRGETRELMDALQHLGHKPHT
jgi:hypothetical protein